jgi:hypothetical protein
MLRVQVEQELAPRNVTTELIDRNRPERARRRGPSVASDSVRAASTSTGGTSGRRFVRGGVGARYRLHGRRLPHPRIRKKIGPPRANEPLGLTPRSPPGMGHPSSTLSGMATVANPLAGWPAALRSGRVAFARRRRPLGSAREARDNRCSTRCGRSGPGRRTTGRMGHPVARGDSHPAPSPWCSAAPGRGMESEINARRGERGTTAADGALHHPRAPGVGAGSQPLVDVWIGILPPRPPR